MDILGLNTLCIEVFDYSRPKFFSLFQYFAFHNPYHIFPYHRLLYVVLQLLDVFNHVVHTFLLICILLRCISVCIECCISSRRALPLLQSSGLEVIDNAVTSKVNQTGSKSTSSTLSLTHKCCYYILTHSRHLYHYGSKTPTTSR